MPSRHLHGISLGLLLAMIAYAPGSRADVLIDRPLLVPGNTWTSSFVDASYNYFVTLDDFELARDSTVSGVAWRGMYLHYDETTDAFSGVAPDTTRWTIAVVTANSSPGLSFDFVASIDVDASDVTRTQLGTRSLNGSSPIPYYDFSVALPSALAFHLEAGVAYHLGLLSWSDDPSSGLFSWMSGSGGDGNSRQYSTYTNTTYDAPLDRSFTLTGRAIPEPASLATAAIGAIGVLGFARRRKAA